MVGAREEISFDEVAEFFTMPILEASQKLGVCNSTLKRVCRENGIPRWPYRKVMAGRTVEEIKEEAARNLAKMRMGGMDGGMGDDDADDGDAAGGPSTVLSRSQPREGLSVHLRMPGTSTRAAGGQQISGTKRPMGTPQKPGADSSHEQLKAPERNYPPIIKSIFAQASLSPPGFPFPYPIPLPKRHASEQWWKQPSFLRSVEVSGFEQPLPSATGDLWGQQGRLESIEGERSLGSGALPSSNDPKRAVDALRSPGEEVVGSDALRTPGQECVGFDASVFDAIGEVRQIRELQAARFTRGIKCALTRGYEHSVRQGDTEVLEFVFGDFMPGQWYNT